MQQLCDYATIQFLVPDVALVDLNGQEHRMSKRASVQPLAAVLRGIKNIMCKKQQLCTCATIQALVADFATSKLNGPRTPTAQLFNY